ncbi:MAG: hypothetical protein KJZ47_05475, partial [Gemmatimonadales bacterium]|nr:hypothetical protein [Gemmatimonadales bacterium]
RLHPRRALLPRLDQPARGRPAMKAALYWLLDLAVTLALIAANWIWSRRGRRARRRQRLLDV